MAKGYWIARMTILDQTSYDAYRALNGKAFSKFGARFLVRGGAFECVEGKTLERHVVIEFDSYETALACYRSPEYAEAMAHRPPAVALADLVIVAGYDGPQP
jgi:uncharacterized protein (DUF1330 family)